MSKYIVFTSDGRIVLGWAYPTKSTEPSYEADAEHYIKLDQCHYLHVEVETEDSVSYAYPFVEKQAKDFAKEIGGRVEFIP